MHSIPNASDILLAVIDATPDAIFVKDLEGRYVLVNRAAARFVGRTADQDTGSGLGLSMVYGSSSARNARAQGAARRDGGRGIAIN